MSNRVITLWFCALELMLGATRYAYEVNMRPKVGRIESRSPG